MSTPRRMRLSIVGKTEDQPRLLRAWGRVPGGEVALVHRCTEGKGLLVFMDTKGNAAQVWRPGPTVFAEGITAELSDAPAAPNEAMSPCDALREVKALQRELPKEGPVTLRGQWSGALVWEDGQPHIELEA